MKIKRNERKRKMNIIIASNKQRLKHEEILLIQQMKQQYNKLRNI